MRDQLEKTLQEKDWVGRSVLAMAVQSGSKCVVEEVLRHVSKKKVSCHHLPIAGTFKPHTTVPGSIHLPHSRGTVPLRTRSFQSSHASF